ncbi:MAG: helix-turn-helix transcriptional regulator [Pseudomonadota bacterium]
MDGDLKIGLMPRLASSIERTDPTELDRRRISEHRKLAMLYCVFAIQALSAFFFLGELWTEILGLRKTPIPYAYREVIQIFASFGVVIGVLASGMLVRRGLERMDALNRQVEVATGNFETHLYAQFSAWRLSPSEQSVMIYAMKGFSNAEIAEFRSTTSATVKSQMNAIYRKSGLQNRQQLISFLVEELLAGVLPDPEAPGKASIPAE